MNIRIILSNLIIIPEGLRQLTLWCVVIDLFDNWALFKLIELDYSNTDMVKGYLSVYFQCPVTYIPVVEVY